MIYLDANADAPALDAALEAYFEAAEHFGNPSSAHGLGRAAHERLARARAAIAASLGAAPDELVLTSGGTEADALALFGTVGAAAGAPWHVVTTTLEHAAVARTLDELERRGRARVTRVAAGRHGVVEPSHVARALTAETRLCSVVLASNETGVIQPVAEIAERCRAAGVLVHTDAVQAVGKLDVDVARLGVDLLSLSGHKLGAPFGVGALYVRRGVALAPLVAGGGQEGGRRAGTESVAGASALAAALADRPSDGERARLAELRDELEARLEGAGEVEVLGGASPRLCNTSAVRFAGCEGDGIMMALDLDGIAVSTGSACSSGSVEPSPILLGMGLTPAEARATVRYSLTRTTTAADVARAADATVDVVRRMRHSERSR